MQGECSSWQAKDAEAEDTGITPPKKKKLPVRGMKKGGAWKTDKAKLDGQAATAGTSRHLFSFAPSQQQPPSSGRAVGAVQQPSRRRAAAAVGAAGAYQANGVPLL